VITTKARRLMGGPAECLPNQSASDDLQKPDEPGSGVAIPIPSQALSVISTRCSATRTRNTAGLSSDEVCLGFNFTRRNRPCAFLRSARVVTLRKSDINPRKASNGTTHD
jgi:hypothetical protein